MNLTKNTHFVKSKKKRDPKTPRNAFTEMNFAQLNETLPELT